MIPHPSRRRLTLCCAAGVLAGCLSSCAPGSGSQPARGGAGKLRVLSTPAGARISVDDSLTNFRTPSVFSLPTGQHRVALSLAGHQLWEEQVQIGAGASVRVAATLTALPTGSLGVTSVPTGAQIFIDGQPAGLGTPAVVKPIVVGTHTVQVLREGYEHWSQAVVIIPNRHLSVQALLTPSRDTLGHLAIQSHPPRARISLDGYPTGKITPDTLFGVPGGNHRVDLALEGYLPWSGTAVVRERHTENLLVKLRPLSPGGVGNARIETDPPGATITLDGINMRQKTPLDLHGLAPGTYPVELTRPGVQPWRGHLTVLPGERALLKVKFVPAP